MLAAAAFKAPALLASLPLALVAWRARGRRALSALLAGGALSLLLLGLAYAPFWAGLHTFSGLALFRLTYFASVPQALKLLSKQLGLTGEPMVLLLGFEILWLVAFGAGCLLLVRHLWRRGSRLDAVDYAGALVTIFLLYLVTQQRTYWSWYATWPLALAAFVAPRSTALRAAVVLAAGSLLGSAVYRFVPPLSALTRNVQWIVILLSFGPLLAYLSIAAARGLAFARRRDAA